MQEDWSESREKQANEGTTNLTEATKTHSIENLWPKDRAGKKKQVEQEKKDAVKAVDNRQQ